MAQLSFSSTIEYSMAPHTTFEATVLSKIESSGAPGEMVSLSFCLSCDQDIQNVEVSACDLKNETATIPRSAIETYVVKVWQQAGVGFYQGAPVEVAELLMKDDREALHDGYSRCCAHWKKPRHWRHFLRAPKFYQAPVVRLKGNARTSLRAGQQKQIWIVVKIPPGARAGCYKGHILCEFAGQSAPLEIAIEVWPLQLLQPAQDFFLWYKGTLDCLLPRHHVSERQFRAHLRDIYEHGFTSISLGESQPHLLQKALDIAHETGFRRNIVLLQPWPKNFDTIDFKGLTPILYISDEVEVRGDTFRESHRANLQKARALGFKTMASSTHQASSQRLLNEEETADAPDIFSYYLPDNLHYFVFRSEFAAVQQQTAYYYWFSSMEKPDLHRVLAGLWLWKSRAEGIAPYCYQHGPGAPFSPFDDFDGAKNDAPELDAANLNRPTKDIMTTYPASAGSIPTVQWKGIAEGIGDLKYLTTLEDALQKAATFASPCTQEMTRKIRQRVDIFLERIRLNSIEIRSSVAVEPYADIASAEYREFRTQMARDIIALQTLSERQSKST